MARMVQKKGGRHESGNPAQRSSSSGSAGSTGSGGQQLSARGRFERASAPWVLMLSRLPRWVFPILMAALLVAGLMVNPGWIGALLLVILSLFLVWLTALSWPVLSPSAKLLRGITILAALGVAYARLTGML